MTNRSPHDSGWNELVASAQREAAATPPVPTTAARRPRWSGWWLYGVGGLAVLVSAGVLAWQELAARPPTEAELDQGRRALLALVDDSVADHVRLRGTYPDSLDEVVPLHVDVEYHRTSSGYELAVRLSDGQLVVRKSP